MGVPTHPPIPAPSPDRPVGTLGLGLAMARTIVDGTLAHARQSGARPLAVIVVDAGAHAVAFAREDGASLFRFDIARAKAVGALGMGADTRVLAERAQANPTFFQSVAAAVPGDLVFSAGGVLITDADGRVLGAVGVSGDTGDVDEICALAGLAAAGLSEAPRS